MARAIYRCGRCSACVYGQFGVIMSLSLRLWAIEVISGAQLASMGDWGYKCRSARIYGRFGVISVARLASMGD